jgi:hypothetical protein
VARPGGEFAAQQVSRAKLRDSWNVGWKTLFDTLGLLTDADLGRTVTIRGEPLAVRAALLRSLAHVGYHIGQMVMLGRSIRGGQWQFLSIPPGKSAEYNRAPSMERAPATFAAAHDDVADRIINVVSAPVWHGPVLAEVLGDLKAAEAAASPAARCHSIGEIVGHLVHWCEDARACLAAHGDVDFASMPGEGDDWPVLPEGLAEPQWRALVENLIEGHHKLAREAKVLSPVRLSARASGRKGTVEQMLQGVVEHAAFHVGQIIILRQLLRADQKDAAFD